MVTIKLIGTKSLIPVLTQADSELYSAAVRSSTHSSMICTTVCTCLITTTTVATAAISGTITSETAIRTSVRSLDALLAEKNRCVGSNVAHRLCAAHGQKHLAKSSNVVARIHLRTLRDPLDSSDRADVP